MSIQYELERIVIRLIGDGSSYQRMLNKAISRTKEMAKLVQSHTARMAALDRDFKQKMMDSEKVYGQRVQSLTAARNRKLADAERLHNQRLSNISNDHDRRAGQINRERNSRVAAVNRRFDLAADRADATRTAKLKANKQMMLDAHSKMQQKALAQRDEVQRQFDNRRLAHERRIAERNNRLRVMDDTAAKQRGERLTQHLAQIRDKYGWSPSKGLSKRAQKISDRAVDRFNLRERQIRERIAQRDKLNEAKDNSNRRAIELKAQEKMLGIKNKYIESRNKLEASAKAKAERIIKEHQNTVSRLGASHNQALAAANQKRDEALARLNESTNKKKAMADQSYANKKAAIEAGHQSRLATLQASQQNRSAQEVRMHQKRLEKEEAAHKARVMAIREARAGQKAEHAEMISGRAGVVGKGIGIGIGATGFLGVKEYAKFNKSMVESISIIEDQDWGNITPDQMTKFALDLTKEVVHAPAELAHSYFELASAGKSAAQSMALLHPISKFATAGVFDLNTATQLLLQSQAALQLHGKGPEEDAKNLQRISDVLVMGNIKSYATTQQLAESLENHAAAAFRTVNKEVEEGVALLMAFSKEHRGVTAGSMASRVIRLLGPESTRGTEAGRRKHGFQVFDEKGEMRHMADIVDQLTEILGKMSPKQRGTALEEMGFEARIQHAVLPLLGMGQQIRDWEADLKRAGGTTERIARIQLEAFANKLKIVRNNLLVFLISVGKSLAPTILMVGNFIKKLTSLWERLDERVKKSVVGFAAISLVLSVLALAGKYILPLLGPLRILTVLFAGLAAALSIVGMVFTPIGALLLIGAGLIAGWVDSLGGLDKAWSTVTEAANKFYKDNRLIFNDLESLIKSFGQAGVDAIRWLYKNGKQLLQNLGTFFEDVLKSMGTNSSEVWTKIKEGFHTAIQFMEFTLKHFNMVADLSWTAIKFGGVTAADFIAEHVFLFLYTGVAIKVFSKIVKAWGLMWVAMIAGAVLALAAVGALVGIIIGAALKAAFKGKEIDWNEVHQAIKDKLGEGYEDAILNMEFKADIAGIDVKKLKDMKAQLGKELNDKGIKVGAAFEEWKTKKFLTDFTMGLFGNNPEFLKQTEEVAKATGRTSGKGFGEEFGKGMKNPLESALRWSAEAITRIADYKTRMGFGGATGTGVQRGGGRFGPQMDPRGWFQAGVPIGNRMPPTNWGPRQAEANAKRVDEFNREKGNTSAEIIPVLIKIHKTLEDYLQKDIAGSTIVLETANIG